MRPIIKIAALAVVAALALAACNGGDDTAGTPVPGSSLSAEASGMAELSARLDQLELQLGDDVEAGVGDDTGTRLDDVGTRLDDLEARLDGVDPADLQARISELEEQIKLVSLAVEELGAPTNLGLDGSAAPE